MTYRRASSIHSSSGISNPVAASGELKGAMTLPSKVGSRELKTRLGSYLRLVRQGAVFVVTDRGRPVAELRPLPIDESSLSEKLYELATAGVIGQEISERSPLPPFESIVARGTGSASEAILEGREDRF